MNVVKDYLETILFIASLLGIVWQAAKTKADIEVKVDLMKDELLLQLHEFKREFSIHRTEFEGKKEAYEYRFHGLDETLKHKFQRCWDKIEEYHRILDDLKITSNTHSNELKMLEKLPPQIQQIQGFLIKSHDFAVRSTDGEG